MCGVASHLGLSIGLLLRSSASDGSVSSCPQPTNTYCERGAFARLGLLRRGVVRIVMRYGIDAVPSVGNESGWTGRDGRALFDVVVRVS